MTNTHGGRRAGAGAKPKLADLPALRTTDPQKWLEAFMTSPSLPLAARKDAAKALLRAKSQGIGEEEEGKKAQKRTAAARLTRGRFAPGKSPRLRVVK